MILFVLTHGLMVTLEHHRNLQTHIMFLILNMTFFCPPDRICNVLV